jgi:hypothetical protein
MQRVIVHAAATFAADARQEKTARSGAAFCVMQPHHKKDRTHEIDAKESICKRPEPA